MATMMRLTDRANIELIVRCNRGRNMGIICEIESDLGLET